MSLKVWLPLNGSLENKGCGNYPLTMHRGNLVYHDDGKIGKCFYANGVNTLQIQNIIPDFYNISGYSLCAWFYIESNNTSHSACAVISAGNWNQEVLNLSLSDWISDHYTKIRISGTNWNRTYPYNFFKDKWYHVVVCSDQNKTYAYVNGLLIGDTADSFLPSNISGNNIDIGGATYYPGMQFFGRINDVRIYNNCLSPLEIKEISQGLVLHYKFDNIDYKIQDSSGYNNNGILTGAIESNINSNRYSSCIYIPSGNTDYIATQNIIGNFSEGITMNIWFKSSNTAPGNSYHQIFNIATATQDFEFAIYKTGFFRGGMKINGTRYVANTNNTDLLNGQWHMITMTYDGAEVKRYVDGILKSTSVISGVLSTTSCKFLWGHYGTNLSYYTKEAYLSDARIYVTALSQEDINKLYNTSMRIDNLNKIHVFELNENGQNKLTKTGTLKNIMIEPYLTLKDGSKWKLMLFHYVDGGKNLFTSSNASYYNGFGLYSRLKDIDKYTYDGKYEFYVLQDDKEFRWTQTSAPTSSSITGKTVVDGYSDPVNGLAKGTTSNTYIGYNAWWGACGCWVSYTTGGKKGIPGFGPHGAEGMCVNYLALYVRVNQLNFKIENLIDYGFQLIER